MGRTLSIALQNTLANIDREIVWALDITFPGSSEAFHFATKPLIIGGTEYVNHINSIGDVRQSIESPADRVRVAIQNIDRVLGLHIIENFNLWRSAEARISRKYISNGTSQLVEIFRGAVQATTSDDKQVSFDIIPDTLTPGQIVSNRNLAPQCGAPFKNPLLCGYSGDALVCDHHLKSTGGCEGLLNDHRFLGMEHRNDPDQRVPGEPGDPIDPNDGGIIIRNGDDWCPRVDQYVRIYSKTMGHIAVRAEIVRAGDDIWHPVKRKYFAVRSKEIINNVPIWRVETENGAVGYSSFRHPLISNEEDTVGKAAEFTEFGESVLTEIDDVLYESMLTESTDTGELGDVVCIEIDSEQPGEKIYSYGENPDRLLVCHNLKWDRYQTL